MWHLGFADFSLRQRGKHDPLPSDMNLERVTRFVISCRTQVRRLGGVDLLMEAIGELAPYVRWQRSNDGKGRHPTTLNNFGRSAERPESSAARRDA
ncbi:hypothetical protein [Paraburkholderia sediminicola]|uniref:hypothetical protein n=1 Tax=Paraburkholderia sediminicola TaxID=458836 RepID=UPI0038BB3A4A